MNIYLEVDIHENGIEIFDWTHWFEFKLNYNGGDLASSLAHKNDVRRELKRFKTVNGKHINYYVAGFKSDEQAKQFAIWYHTTKSGGSISTYRLDFTYSTTRGNETRRKRRGSS